MSATTRPDRSAAPDPGASAAAVSGAPPSSPDQAWLVPLTVLVAGSFMCVLDTSIVNVAISKMQVDLSAAPDDVAWVATGYTLAAGVVVPLTGWLSARFGDTRFYVTAMILFAGASALCGFAWNLPAMIAFRLVQAVPGGLIPVLTMTMLYKLVPKDRLGAAMGVYGLGVVVAPAVGPVLGGYLVEYIDWRLIFFINVPIGAVGTAAALAIFPRTKVTGWPKFDALGFATIAYGLFALLLALSEGADWGWSGYRILGLIVSGVLSLATFVFIELEVANPLIDLRVFTSMAYLNSTVLLAIAMTGMFSSLYFIPQYLQSVRGYQALDAGMVMAVPTLVILVLMPVAGRIYDAIGPRLPAVVGMVVMAWASFLMARMTVETPTGEITRWLSLRNVGTGLAMMPIMTSGLASLRAELTGSGSAMNNITRQVFSSVAVAGFGAMGATAQAQLMVDRGALLDSGAQELPDLSVAEHHGASGLLGIYQELSSQALTQTYSNGFYVVAWLCALGVLLALPMRSGPAPATDEPAVVEV
jgi:EmrB/QacA subfamily drug resistance transporter